MWVAKLPLEMMRLQRLHSVPARDPVVVVVVVVAAGVIVVAISSSSPPAFSPIELIAVRRGPRILLPPGPVIRVARLAVVVVVVVVDDADDAKFVRDDNADNPPPLFLFWTSPGAGS